MSALQQMCTLMLTAAHLACHWLYDVLHWQGTVMSEQNHSKSSLQVKSAVRKCCK